MTYTCVFAAVSEEHILLLTLHHVVFLSCVDALAGYGCSLSSLPHPSPPCWLFESGLGVLVQRFLLVSFQTGLVIQSVIKTIILQNLNMNFSVLFDAQTHAA